MKRGGKGGSRTLTGLHFEKHTSLKDAFLKAGFDVVGDSVFYEAELIGQLCSGERRLYNLLDEKSGFERGGSKRLVSKILRPDEAFLNFSQQTLYIIEKKYQESTGSVDEKPQTVRFKQRQYERLIRNTGLNFQFFYLFNCWYADPSYRDMLDFIVEEGSSYYFNDIPLSRLGYKGKIPTSDLDFCTEHSRPILDCVSFWASRRKKKRKLA